MTARTIRADGVEIATEAFGNAAHPPVLLIMGAMASMLWWPEGFCERLAGQGRYVIRYDNRDTGLSTKYEPGEPPYTFDDMADDAVRVLDGYGIGAAHLAGMSLGGMIAQLAALKHPARVATVTVISTSPVGTDTSHLPHMTQAYREHSAKAEVMDWSDRAQVIGFMVADVRALAGTAHPHDAVDAKSMIERDYDRSGGLATATNHFMLKGGDAWQGRLGEMRAPLLVIHGTADPIFPVEHGQALAQAVAGARLVRLEGGGHELHPMDWDRIIGAMVEHTATARESPMPKLVAAFSMSLDGFVAGPDVDVDQPMGQGGERLHDWLFKSDSGADATMARETFERVGAVLLGRRTFDLGIGQWEDTPFPAPSFVLTHRGREPLVMKSGTFVFVTGGIDSALEQAKRAAGGKDVIVMGAETAQQYLKAGLVDEIALQLVPVLLGAGTRLFDRLGERHIELVATRTVESPSVTHLRLEPARDKHASASGAGQGEKT